MPTNRCVRIGRETGKELDHGDAARSPARAPNLTAIKAEITATWPMTSLLDMLKETDLRLNFTDALKSPTAYETLDRDGSAAAALALPEWDRDQRRAFSAWRGCNPG